MPFRVNLHVFNYRVAHSVKNLQRKKRYTLFKVSKFSNTFWKKWQGRHDDMMLLDFFSEIPIETVVIRKINQHFDKLGSVKKRYCISSREASYMKLWFIDNGKVRYFE